MFSYYTHVQVRYSKAENKTEDKTHEQKQTGSFSKVVGMCSKVVGMCSKVVIYIYTYTGTAKLKTKLKTKLTNKNKQEGYMTHSIVRDKTQDQKQTGRIYDDGRHASDTKYCVKQN